MGKAGNAMASSCPRRFQCGTIVPGWLNGELPSVQDGVVSRRICFHQSRNCCYESTEAKVRNCGMFYVYYLHPAPYCQLRYCGNGKTVRKKCLCRNKNTIYGVSFSILHRAVTFITGCFVIMYVIVLQVHQQALSLK